MQPARSMFLNDKTRCAFDFFWNRFAWRLVGVLEVPFAFVVSERHSTQLNHGLAEWPRGLSSCSPRRTPFPKFGVRCYNYASFGSGSPTRYRPKRRMTMFFASSVSFEFTRSL